MDWQFQLISLFLKISHHHDGHLWQYCQRFSNNQHPEFSDVEVLMVYLWGLLQGQQSLKGIHLYTCQHLGSWFAKIPVYETWLNRLNRLESVLSPLLEVLLSQLLKGVPESYHLINSMPLMLSTGPRSRYAKVVREYANQSYNSSRETWYHGVKLHVLGVDRRGSSPLPEYLTVTPASVHDLALFKTIAENLFETQVFADKAYCDQNLKSK